ncbi:MAG: TetR/AcrR family transcriptional regulator [Gemmatimonadales bacterium]|nr:TetR/AcrR family transcriptional regulator [Gemmatimonadales bacterium]
MPTSRRSPLTRERVLRAAVRLADKQGLDALSMRRLAATLKVEAMSLYNHVANKDDVLDGMVDLIIGEITLPTPGDDWKAAMRARATSAHAVMLAHPWAPMLVVSRITIGPNRLRYIDATLGVLRQAGLSWAETDRAWTAMDSYIYGFTLQVQNFPIDPEEYASAAASYLPMLPAETYPYMHELSKCVAEGSHDGTHDFGFGLELILDGLEGMMDDR